MTPSDENNSDRTGGAGGPIPTCRTRVWCGRVSELLAAVDGADGWLTAAEGARRDRFLFDADRRSFTAGRVLLKRALSYRTGVPPESWRIVPDALGAIAIDPSQNPDGRHISLSRRRRWVACVISTARCGVDIEDTTRDVDIDGVSRTVLTPAERSSMAALDADGGRRFFFERWCLKEAYVKALGVGFHLAPTRFQMRVDDSGRVRVAPAEPLPYDGSDRADRYRFILHDVSATHLLAATYETGTDEGSASGAFEIRDCSRLSLLG